jgi:hypothetical protein
VLYNPARQSQPGERLVSGQNGVSCGHSGGGPGCPPCVAAQAGDAGLYVAVGQATEVVVQRGGHVERGAALFRVVAVHLQVGLHQRLQEGALVACGGCRVGTPCRDYWSAAGGGSAGGRSGRHRHALACGPLKRTNSSARCQYRKRPSGPGERREPSARGGTTSA